MTEQTKEQPSMKIHSDVAWGIASRYACILASETRDLAGAIDKALQDQAARLYTRDDLERYRECPYHLEPDECRSLCGPNCTGALARGDSEVTSTDGNTATGGGE